MTSFCIQTCNVFLLNMEFFLNFAKAARRVDYTLKAARRVDYTLKVARRADYTFKRVHWKQEVIKMLKCIIYNYTRLIQLFQFMLCLLDLKFFSIAKKFLIRWVLVNVSCKGGGVGTL